MGEGWGLWVWYDGEGMCGRKGGGVAAVGEGRGIRA